jgi:hypothetical protein
MAEMNMKERRWGAFGGWLVVAILVLGVIWFVYSLMQGRY